jgi:glycosyltransferase involved in cell wall biosynthesis
LTSADIQVSVIIPVFNDVRVRLAVESVAMQNTNFDTEIIVIDDGSTDTTPLILEGLKAEFPSLRLLSNPANLGKGASFRSAYLESRGKYIHVLDSDDFFSNQDKLQIQFDELENDAGIFAVATNTLVAHASGRVELLCESMRAIDYTYHQFINFEFYHHTSAYLFRKIDTEIPPQFDTERGLRGDTACMYFHGYHTGLGVRFLPIVASVYSSHGQGLWSSLSSPEKESLILEAFLAIKNFVIEDSNSVESQILSEKIHKLQLTQPQNSNESPEGIERAELLRHWLHTLRNQHTPPNNYEIFQGAYRPSHSQVIDSYLETLGNLIVIESGLSQHQGRPSL